MFEAASKVHDKQNVAWMLSKTGILRHSQYGATALHLAARHGHDLVIAQLLAESPKSALVINDALRLAVGYGHDKAVAVLLDHRLKSIKTGESKMGDGLLHIAARNSYDRVVAQLLAAYPNSASEVDSRGWNALHVAALNGQESIVDMLLASNPQLIHALTDRGETVLHLASESRSRNQQFYANLLMLNPDALRAVDSNSSIPFNIAVECENDCAIELMQKNLTFEEIARAFGARNKIHEERLRPIVEEQCECLKLLLNQDVIGMVFEYLGFDSTKRPATLAKR